MSAAPDLFPHFSVHGSPVRASADTATLKLHFTACRHRSLITIFCDDYGLADALAEAINAAIEKRAAEISSAVSAFEKRAAEAASAVEAA